MTVEATKISDELRAELRSLKQLVVRRVAELQGRILMDSTIARVEADTDLSTLRLRDMYAIEKLEWIGQPLFWLAALLVVGYTLWVASKLGSVAFIWARGIGVGLGW